MEATLYTTYQFNNHSVTDYVDKYLYVVDYVHIARGLPGNPALAYFVYTKSVECVDVNTLDAPNREISAQQYLTALLFLCLKNRYLIN